MKRVWMGVLVATVMGCAEDRWMAIVYPDSSNLIVYELAGEYSDLETCRAASLARLRTLGASITGDYECGSNCERDEEFDWWVCEETAQ